MSCITNEQRVALKRVLAGYDELIYRFDDLDTNDFCSTLLRLSLFRGDRDPSHYCSLCEQEYQESGETGYKY